MPDRDEESPRAYVPETTEDHEYREYNPNGNSCHYPNCTLTVEGHTVKPKAGER